MKTTKMQGLTFSLTWVRPSCDLQLMHEVCMSAYLSILIAPGPDLMSWQGTLKEISEVCMASCHHLHTRISGLAWVQAPSLDHSRSRTLLLQLKTSMRTQKTSTTKTLHPHASHVSVWYSSRMPNMLTVWMKTSCQHAAPAQKDEM